MKGYNVRSKILPDGQIQAEFHVKPINYIGIDGQWHPLEEIAYGFGNTWMHIKEDWHKYCDPGYLVWWTKRAKLLGGVGIYTWPKVPVFLNTVNTYYPDPHPETTTVDGYVQNNTGQTNWSTVRDGATGTAVGDSDTSARWCSIRTGGSSQWDSIIRGYTLFDTSGLGAAATITAATYSLYGTAKQSDYGGDVELRELNSGVPASDTALATGDYDITGFITGTDLSSTNISVSGWNTAAYNDWTLNADGRAAINKTGVTRIGILQSDDVADSEPTPGASQESYVQGYHADRTGTSEDPKLAVTFTGGGALGAIIF